MKRWFVLILTFLAAAALGALAPPIVVAASVIAAVVIGFPLGALAERALVERNRLDGEAIRTRALQVWTGPHLYDTRT